MKIIRDAGRPQLFVTIFTGIFILLALLLMFDCGFDTITMTVRLQSEKPGVIAIYWPDDSGGFSAERVDYRNYPAGESSQVLRLRYRPDVHPLRLDPLDSFGKVIIDSITVERFGDEYLLTARDILGHLVDPVGLACRLTENGLVVDASGEDPQLHLQGLAFPPLSRALLGKFIVLFVLGGVLLVAAGLRGVPPKRTAPYRHLLGSFALLFLCWKVFANPLLVVPACVLFVFYLQRIYQYLLLENFSGLSVRQLNAAVATATFLILCFVPLGKTLQAPSPFLDSLAEYYQDFKAKVNIRGFARELKKIPGDVEDRLTRYLSFRDDLLDRNATFKISVLGMSPTPKVIYGQNSMFFEGYGERRVEGEATANFDNVTDYMGLIPFSEAELAAWKTCLEERYYWLKSRGIDYIFAFAPSKAQIYPENLPPAILQTKKALNKPTRYDQLLLYLKRNSIVPVVDLSMPLKQARIEQLQTGKPAYQLYYRTDFHWTYYGAYLAYREIIAAINQAYPHYDLQAVPPGDFVIREDHHWAHYAFIYSLGLDPHKHMDDSYITFFPKPHTILAGVDGFARSGIDDNSIPEQDVRVYQGRRVPTRVLTNPAGQLPILFIIGDSFAEKYFGFFSAHAQKTVNFRAVYEFFTEPIKAYQPRLVVQEVLNMYLLRPPPKNPPELRDIMRDEVLAADR